MGNFKIDQGSSYQVYKIQALTLCSLGMCLLPKWWVKPVLSYKWRALGRVPEILPNMPSWKKIIKGQNLCNLLPLCSMGSNAAGLLTAFSMLPTRSSRLWVAVQWTPKCRWAIAIWSHWTVHPAENTLLHDELKEWKIWKQFFCLCPWWRGEMAPVNLWDLNWAGSWCWFKETIGYVDISAQLCWVSAKYFGIYLVLLFKSWAILYGFLQFCSSPGTHLFFLFNMLFFLLSPFPCLKYKELLHSAIKSCTWFQNGKKCEFPSSDNLTLATSCSS